MKKFFSFCAVICLAALFSSCSLQYRHQVEKPGTKANWQYGWGGFMRYSGYGNVAGDMDIPVIVYEKKGSPIKVQMVGVVHFAEKNYYKKLQKVLDSSDFVLYEGVNVSGKEGGPDPLSLEQNRILAAIYGLDGQLENIQYGRKHFKQCDLITSPDFYQKRMAMQQEILKKLQKDLAKRNKGKKMKVIPMPINPQQNMEKMGEMVQRLAFRQKIREIKKLIGKFTSIRTLEDSMQHQMALQFSKMNQFNTGNANGLVQIIEKAEDLLRKAQRIMPGNEILKELSQNFRKIKKAVKAMMESQMKLIIIDRNIYVMKELDKELVKIGTPKKPYTLSIFYGAGHLQDFNKRMIKKGYKISSIKWYSAWRIDGRHIKSKKAWNGKRDMKRRMK